MQRQMLPVADSLRALLLNCSLRFFSDFSDRPGSHDAQQPGSYRAHERARSTVEALTTFRLRS